ncbi:BON domain-containing protein [Nitrosomonas sp. Is37]|uniref:BON domain-containing protein n=1 Tax=Nitrosomonas sp. Is37 TaxID=3080535 RepID=UPI00294B8E69|nr:BON domain-containing protein [Nitrosomonas sp. Is37]MDV6345435.1 BON domain-containing protein [Nitrosomonas sp. Is37]
MNNSKYYPLLLISLLPILSGCVPLVATGVGVGAGTGALMSEDRRSSGTFIDDQAIELKTSRKIHEQLGSDVRISVTSFNRNVLLTGEAPNESMKSEAEKLATSVDNVRKVYNEITISEKSALSSRTNDSLITSKVIGRFLSERKFQINYVKVVTENSIVYLLGLVTREEAENAAQIASTTAGARKVVKVFEYLN